MSLISAMAAAIEAQRAREALQIELERMQRLDADVDGFTVIGVVDDEGEDR